ncbi:MAG: hypothetical protein QNL12_07020 [Acidimicrobiia bacterium]|nr:hypothetical protein [Acidimicrobiia bacterium]MDX2467046.1 hypothetical protein [Acidimicrobiia bacterium]
MNRIIESIPRRARVIVMLAAAAAAVWLWLAMAEAMEPAEATGGGDIVSFEFAATAARATEILGGWGDVGRRGAARAIRLDYGFLIVYATLLALLAGSVAMAARQRVSDRIYRLGWTAAALAVGAGALDAIENTMLLATIGRYDAGEISGAHTAVAALAAGPKFVFLILTIVYVVGVAGYLWSKRLSS